MANSNHSQPAPKRDVPVRPAANPYKRPAAANRQVAQKQLTLEHRLEEITGAAQEGDFEKAKMMLDFIEAGKMCAGALSTASFWLTKARIDEFCGEHDQALQTLLKAMSTYHAEPVCDIEVEIQDMYKRRMEQMVHPTQNCSSIIGSVVAVASAVNEAAVCQNTVDVQPIAEVVAAPSPEPVPAAAPDNIFAKAFAKVDMSAAFSGVDMKQATSAMVMPDMKLAMSGMAQVDLKEATSALTTADGATEEPSAQPGTPTLVRKSVSRSPRPSPLGSARRVKRKEGQTPEEATKTHLQSERIAEVLKDSLFASPSIKGLGGAGRVDNPDAKEVVVLPEGGWVKQNTIIAATKKQKEVTGSPVVLTPTRRSRRHLEEAGAEKQAQLLGQANFSFVPNEALESEVPDTEARAKLLLQNARRQTVVGSPMRATAMSNMGCLSPLEDMGCLSPLAEPSPLPSDWLADNSEEQPVQEAALQVMDCDFDKYLLADPSESPQPSPSPKAKKSRRRSGNPSKRRRSVRLLEADMLEDAIVASTPKGKSGISRVLRHMK